ncbi:MAG TPA: hypothetical protein VMH02_08700 [Verrucomicrobiae bacterium]|nr:hypothetical protein [Verrucomicrobiae bacterium]
MKVLAVVLAVVFFLVGILYYLGKINFLTESGTAHSHHVSHLILFWVLALLCLIWARFQGSPAR